MTPPRVIADGLGPLLWDSRAVVVAVIGRDLEIVRASPHLASVTGRELVGEPATSLVTPGQAQALTDALTTAFAGAGSDWSDLVVGLAGAADGVPLDYRIRLAARDGSILLVGEPSVMDTSMVDEQLLEVTEDLISEQRRITRDRDRLGILTTTDPLTGLGNRRRLEADLAQRIAGASSAEPVSVVFADIDHFKTINDESGHAAGDDVLRFVSELLKATCRADDVVARFGGEEFVAVLPRTDLDGAARWAERARSTVAERRAPGIGRSVTASFGVAEYRDGESADDLLARADAALYAAKAGGRDRVGRAAAVGEAAPTVVEPTPNDTLPGFAHAPRLSEVIWQSSGVGVAEFDGEGHLVGANGAFRRLLGDAIEGRSLADLVSSAQSDAIARYIGTAGPDWVRGQFGLSTGPQGVPLDRVLWLRRNETGLDLIVDVDPDRPETTEAPLLGLVDDLIRTQRELTGTNQRLQRTLDALEAASREVRRLREIVPMCAWCRRIRVEGSDQPEWLTTEEFLGRDQVAVSHGICDDCAAREQRGELTRGARAGARARTRR